MTAMGARERERKRKMWHKIVDMEGKNTMKKEKRMPFVRSGPYGSDERDIFGTKFDFLFKVASVTATHVISTRRKLFFSFISFASFVARKQIFESNKMEAKSHSQPMGHRRVAAAAAAATDFILTPIGRHC